jgi:hypothetical protein
MPMFEVELWPEEGRPVFQAVASRVRLHEQPSASSKITSVATLSPRQRLSFDETRYRTIKAGRLRVVAPTQVRGRVLGAVTYLSKGDYYSAKFVRSTLQVRPGTMVEYLQYRAEGTCFVRLGANVIDASPCPAGEAAFKVESEPRTEWWIHVVLSSDTTGWLLVNHTTVKEIDREG